MILNTGSRTDIPAYFSKWFYNRIKEGYVLTRNPYNPQQVTKFLLDPELVDCLVFCTKNPRPMLIRLSEISQFRQFWGVTITPYGRDIEPFVPEKERVMESFQKLSEAVGIQCVSWRYDPIFISEKCTLEYHIEAFEKMAKELQGYTDHCVISFVDLYAKTKRNFKGVKEVSKEDRHEIGREFVRIGKKYGMKIKTCSEGTELKQYGVDCSGCMTKEVIERAIGCGLDMPKGKPAREGCNCLLGNDIGMYNTCGHGCLYCYANYDQETVDRNRKQHNPESPFLIGELREEDVVRQAKQESYLDGQMSFL